MKKRFRQLLSMVLAASMVLSLPMSALAEDGGLIPAILWLPP